MSSITFDRSVIVQLSRDSRFNAVLPQLSAIKLAAAGTVTGKGCGCRRKTGVTETQIDLAKNSLANLFTVSPEVVQQVKALLGVAELRIKLLRRERNVTVVKKF